MLNITPTAHILSCLIQSNLPCSFLFLQLVDKSFSMKVVKQHNWMISKSFSIFVMRIFSHSSNIIWLLEVIYVHGVLAMYVGNVNCKGYLVEELCLDSWLGSPRLLVYFQYLKTSVRHFIKDYYVRSCSKKLVIVLLHYTPLAFQTEE